MTPKNKRRIYDACTYQNYVAGLDAKLSHCFFTLTYATRPADPNKDIGRFLDDLRKHSKRVYPEIGDRFSYLWVRELTKKGIDHFHVCAVIPVFPISPGDRKHKGIKYSIPFRYSDEAHNRFYSLNKSWSKIRGGEYASNAVRISKDKTTGKSKFRIASLQSAIRYVAKYASKGMTDDDGHLIPFDRPVLRMSDNLTPWTKPLKYDHVLDFAYHWDWGDSIRYKENGETIEKKVLKFDYATVGKVKIEKSVKVWAELQAYLIGDQIKALQTAAHIKKIQVETKRVYTEKRRKEAEKARIVAESAGIQATFIS